MKKGTKIAAYILIVVLLLNSALLLVLLTYQDEIADKAKAEIAANFKSKISIGRIAISPFRKFPKIAIILKDIHIQENPEFGNAELATIDRVYLFMNPFTFFKKSYVIDKVEFNVGEVFVRINETGQGNYKVWKERDEESKSYSLDLQKILLHDFIISYSDLSTNQELIAEIENIDCKGLFTEKDYTVKIGADAFLNSFTIGRIQYIENDKLEITAEIQVNNELKSYTIESSDIILDKIEIDLKGIITAEIDSTFKLDLNSLAKGIELEKLLIFVPDSSQQIFNDYKLDGIFDFTGKVTGLYGKDMNPHIDLDFTITNGIITNIESKTSLSNISLIGKLDNGDQNSATTSSLHMSSIKANLNESSHFANFIITNFTDAYIQGEVQSDLNLDDLISFYPIHDFEVLSGEIFLKAEVNSKLDKLINNIQGLEFVNAEIDLKKINVKYDTSKYYLEDLSGTIIINEGRVELSDISGIFTTIQIDVDGHLNSLFSYLYDQNNKLTGKIKLKTSAFKLDELLEMEDESRIDTLHLPSNMDVKIDLLCNGLIYESFVTERIRGWISIEDKVIMLDRLNLDVAQGIISMKGMLEETPDARFALDAAARFNQIDINEVLILFDNFKQDFITSDNLYGKVNGHVQLSSIWDQNLTLDLDQLFVLSDVIIDNGNLKNFKPLIDVMGFVKMKKMKNIEFDRLENSILIKDRTITIPNMDIRNSALTMSLSGTHSFEDEIDYHFKINLSELFFKRHQQLKKDFNNAEEDSKGGINFYVHMDGTTENPNFRMDRKAVRENMNTNLKDEKEEFLDLFRKKKKIVVEEELEFEWEDEK